MCDKKELIETENNDETREKIDDMIGNVSEEDRSVIEKMMISSVQMRGMISSENEVSKKITEEHITQYLEGSRADMEHSYDEKKQRKIFYFLIMTFAMIFFIVVIVLLKDVPEVMEKIIYTVGGLVAGAFGGYGVGRNRNDE